MINTASLEPEEFKRILKSAISEALEDIALRRAIDEGMESPVVSREDVFAVFAS